MLASYSIPGLYSPLGSLGLGTAGTYGSYDAYMPSNLAYSGMGMNSSIFPGGYGMYNPLAYADLQQKMEKNMLGHTNSMQHGILQNDVSAHRATDSALINKIITNGGVNRDIQNLYEKVKDGDQDGICEEFDQLRHTILTRYSDEIKSMGDKVNAYNEAGHLVERLYADIITRQTGVQANLRQDIIKYGDGSFVNGFEQGFRKGHHKRYIDETMMHCFGLSIDEKESKDLKQSIGKGLGMVANVAEKSIYGAGAAAAIAGASTFAVKTILPDSWSQAVKNWKIFGKTPFAKAGIWNSMKFGGKLGLLAGAIFAGYQSFSEA